MVYPEKKKKKIPASLCEDPLEGARITPIGHDEASSVLAWRIPGMGEPGGLPSMESHRVRHD